MECVHCNKEVPEGSAFCLHCGKMTHPKPRRVFSTEALMFAVTLTALVFAVGGGVVYRVVSSQSRSAATASVVTPQTDAGQLKIATAKPSPIPQLHEFTSEELFKLAAPGVVLIEVFDESGENRRTGSGFVVGSGQAVTNYHVIRGAYHFAAHYSDGTTANIVGVLGHDPEADVANLRVTEGMAQPLKLGDSDQLKVGNRVFAIGSPRGLQNTISDGLVSGIRNVEWVDRFLHRR